MDDAPRLLMPAEVATMFRVHRGTVTRWQGLTDIRTPSGRRRYLYDEVMALLDFGDEPKISPSGAGGEPPPEGEHKRPAGIGVPPAEALQLAGRNGAGAPGALGGCAAGAHAPPTPQVSDESGTA